MNLQPNNTRHVTVLVRGGLLSPETMQAIAGIARRYNLMLYCTTLQNVRLLGANDENIEEIQKSLQDLGLQLKVPGKFPLPKVCVGKPFCNLGIADTFALADAIMEKYGGRTEVKPKLKIAVAGCPAGCSGVLLADIGIVATRKGFDLYVGGKGGPLPRVGGKAATGLSEAEVVEAVGRLVDFHTAHTSGKQRMYKLLEMEDFPYPPQN